MDSSEFRCEEYKALREEILQHIRETYRTEVLGAVAIVSVYTWLLTHKQNDVPHIAWFIPSFVVVVCIARCLDLMIRIKAIGKYLERIEQTFLENDGTFLGWEHYKNSRRWVDIGSITVATIVWASILIGVTLASYILSR